MIGAVIFVLSIGAFIQFFFSYCRSLLATYAKVEVSQKAREVAGIAAEPITGEDFHRLVGLIRVAPDPGDDATEIRTVSIYRGIIRLMASLISPRSVKAAQWFDRELALCAHFAAVTLDRRLAVSPD